MMERHEKVLASKMVVTCECCRSCHRHEGIYSTTPHLRDAPSLLRRVPVICSARSDDSVVRRLSDEDFFKEYSSHEKCPVATREYQLSSPMYRDVSPTYQSISPSYRSTSPIYGPLSLSYRAGLSTNQPMRPKLRSPTYKDLSTTYRSRLPSFSPYERLSTTREEDLFQHSSVQYKTQQLTVLYNEQNNNNDNNTRDNVLKNHHKKDIPSPSFNSALSPIHSLHLNTRFVFPPTSHIQSSELRARLGSGASSADYNVSPGISRGIRKRQRTIFTPSQLRKLEEKFKECSFIVGEDRQMLAKELKLKEQQVKIWFQNRRTKCKQSGTTIDVNEESKNPTTEN
ncbi:homeobox protein Hox-B4a-like [Hydractinia symbiolongicarpus]|uniref:homeobox protein Hox-B4a-like n=1 Tax=Hydractinia symbiolongicarpus TaxID=13093 RepID=UPI00254A2678|nr:homeobox protein Hox-B4a-like [Hydractinia symbiolongicarpus]XP_057306670.1 homeobox protein Hox-B4a-like [Hydractinia symbiolongicarpus]XP_057306671.1 homeobox protein Hox-B4a-like [Hydractinia symbiolongicarpus]